MSQHELLQRRIAGIAMMHPKPAISPPPGRHFLPPLARRVICWLFIFALLLLSFALAALTEADFEKLRGPLLKNAFRNYAAAVQQTDALLQQYRSELTLEQQIRLNYHKAIFQQRSNQTNAALQTLALCKSLSLESTDRSILYSYHNILAGIFSDQGLYQQAFSHFQQALPLATLLPNPLFLSQTENNLALVLLKLGQTAEAKSYFQRFYQQGLRDQDPSVQAVALNNLGETALAEGEVSAAQRYHQQALALRGLHQLEASWSFINLARVALAQQDPHSATVLARHSLLLRQQRPEWEQAEAGLLLVQALLQSGAVAEADQQLQQSLQLVQRLQAYALQLQGWQLQADLALRQHKYAQAVVAMQQALKAQQQLADQRFNLTVAQQSAELGVSTREIEIQRLQQQQQANAARQQRLKLLIGTAVLVLLVSIAFSVQIRRKNRALAQSLSELERTRQQLVEERKLAALTHLVSGMAHQLNTPLGTILTAVSCSAEQLKLLTGKLADRKLNLQELEQFIREQQQLMTLAEQSALRTSGLVERFKLISVQQQPSVTENVHLHSFLQQWLEPHLALAATAVQLQIDGADIHWPLDTILFGKVLTALLDNALQHAEPQSGQLQIQLQLEVGPTELRIYFSDNGRGIPQHLQDKIFDPFFTTKLGQSQPGQSHLGLGLNIAYNQLQRIGGSVEFRPDRPGCCFLIRLPAALQSQ